MNFVVGFNDHLPCSKWREIELGKQITNQFIDEFLLSRFDWITVDPLANNPNAIRCNKKCGFKTTEYSEQRRYSILIKRVEISHE